MLFARRAFPSTAFAHLIKKSGGGGNVCGSNFSAKSIHQITLVSWPPGIYPFIYVCVDGGVYFIKG
jgi:hypothetical protein